jgi:2-aminoadipate transaminase
VDIAKSLQQIQPSYIREILAAASHDDVISLAGGLPDPQTFPLDLMQTTLTALVDKPEVFQYGSTSGYAPLIEYLTEQFALLSQHSALITTGSQQGLDLIARAFINPHDNIVMEAPSYLGAMQVFGLVQANILAVSQDDDGPNIDELEQCFREQAPKMFYAVPDFHNPTGTCWSLERRKQVANLCIAFNVTLVEDAPYRELRFTGETIEMVSSFCPSHSLVLRSYSKIASPGLRIGVVTGKTEWINPLIKVKQAADLHSSVPMQALLLDLLQHEKFDQHLNEVHELYKSRYERMAQQLDKALPSGCHFNRVEGGMFVWVELPDCDTFELATHLLNHGIAVVPSDVFYSSNELAKSALRLNFTNSSLEALDKATAYIGVTLADYLKS